MRPDRQSTKPNMRASIVVLCCAMLFIGCGADATPADQATEFWEAVVSGDRDAALSLVDPGALTAGTANTHGRADTLAGQFDWYEAVDWRWVLEGCLEGDVGSAVCTAKASNAWSEVLGVDPVEGTFETKFSEAGVTSIADQNAAFLRQWSAQVFEVFADWVAVNHPDDADVMFQFTVDVNPEILDLYRINSERFVEAHSG